MPKNPMQPLVKLHPNGVVRFKENALVQYLLRNGGIDLNRLALVEASQEDRMQFAQLIGYTLCGYHELSYVTDASARAASAKARRLGLVEGRGGCRDGDGCDLHSGVAKEDD